MHDATRREPADWRGTVLLTAPDYSIKSRAESLGDGVVLATITVDGMDVIVRGTWMELVRLIGGLNEALLPFVPEWSGGRGGADR